MVICYNVRGGDEQYAGSIKILCQDDADQGFTTTGESRYTYEEEKFCRSLFVGSV